MPDNAGQRWDACDSFIHNVQTKQQHTTNKTATTKKYIYK